MDDNGQHVRTDSAISADLAELKRAATQLAALIMQWASGLPKGARKTIAFYVWEMLLYGMKERTADDQTTAIHAKFQALKYAIECCVPLEPQKRKGTMMELMEGSDSSDIDEDEPGAEGKARKKLTSLVANNKRLAKDLETAYAQIADLTAQVTHLRDIQRRQQTAATQNVPSQTAQPSSALIQHVRELEQEKQDIAAQLERALTLVAGQAATIRDLRVAQRTATAAFAVQPGDLPATSAKPAHREKPARAPRAQKPKPVKEDRHGLSPWAWGHFRKTAELTGITFEQFRAKVEDGTIGMWRDEQKVNGTLSEYQWRFVAGVTREIAEQLGKAPESVRAGKPRPAARPARPKSKAVSAAKKAKPVARTEEEIISIGERRFGRKDLLPHSFAKAWFSTVQKATSVSLQAFVDMVANESVGTWLEERNRGGLLTDCQDRRFAVSLARLIARLVGAALLPRGRDHRKRTPRVKAAKTNVAQTGAKRSVSRGVDQSAPKVSAAEKEVITVGDRKFAESDFLSHPFARAWYSAVHKETGCRLVTLVLYVQEGTIRQWLESMDRSCPPERTRRCAVALLRHIANVLGVTPMKKKKAEPAHREKPARAPRAQKPKPVKEDRHGLSPWAWGHFRKTAELTGITFEQFRAKVEDETIGTWRDEQKVNGTLSEYRWRFVAGVASEVAAMRAADSGTAAPAPQPKASPISEPETTPLPPQAPHETAVVPEQMTLEQAVNGASHFGFLMDQEAVGQYSRLHEAGYLQSLIKVCRAAEYDGALKNYVASRMETMIGRLDDARIRDADELARHVRTFVPIWNDDGCLDDGMLKVHAINAGRENGAGPIEESAPPPEPAPIVWPPQPAPKLPFEIGAASEIDDDLIRHVKSLHRRSVFKERLVKFYDRLRSLGFCEDLWDLFRIVEANQVEQRIEWMRANTSASDYDDRNARKLCRFVKNDLGVIDRVTRRLSTEGLRELVRLNALKYKH